MIFSVAGMLYISLLGLSVASPYVMKMGHVNGSCKMK